MFSKILEKQTNNIIILDPVHYFSCHGSAWGAMFKMTGISLELFIDIDIYHMTSLLFSG